MRTPWRWHAWLVRAQLKGLVEWFHRVLSRRQTAKGFRDVDSAPIDDRHGETVAPPARLSHDCRELGCMRGRQPRRDASPPPARARSLPDGQSRQLGLEFRPLRLRHAGAVELDGLQLRKAEDRRHIHETGVAYVQELQLAEVGERGDVRQLSVGEPEVCEIAEARQGSEVGHFRTAQIEARQLAQLRQRRGIRKLLAVVKVEFAKCGQLLQRSQVGHF